MTEDLLKPAIQQFIRDHEQHDPFQLILQAHNYPELPIKEIAEQIRARQKARTKLPEWYHTEGIIFPPLLSMEQCSSEATALYKQKLLQGNRLLDLTGGAGVDTFYMSRSFSHSDYVEQQPALARVALHNFHALGASHRISVHIGQAEDFLQQLSVPVDCLYLDPARRNEHAKKVFRLQDCTPNVLQLADQLMAKAGQVLIKTSPMLDIEATLRSLPYVQQVHVLAVDNECKEVLYLLSKQQSVTPDITAVNIRGQAMQVFTFNKRAEEAAQVHYARPLTYLYEPNAALLKAGAFKSIAQAYQFAKLHPHTHLYTSEILVPDFPGRIFCCEAVTNFSRKEVLPHVPDKKANITTRNFPVSVKEARKKLGLQEGGTVYIFLSLIGEKPQAIITKKIN